MRVMSARHASMHDHENEAQPPAEDFPGDRCGGAVFSLTPNMFPSAHSAEYRMKFVLLRAGADTVFCTSASTNSLIRKKLDRRAFDVYASSLGG